MPPRSPCQGGTPQPPEREGGNPATTALATRGRSPTAALANPRAATLRTPASQREGGVPQRAICCRTRCGSTQAKFILQFCRCAIRMASGICSRTRIGNTSAQLRLQLCRRVTTTCSATNLQAALATRWQNCFCDFATVLPEWRVEFVAARALVTRRHNCVCNCADVLPQHVRLQIARGSRRRRRQPCDHRSRRARAALHNRPREREGGNPFTTALAMRGRSPTTALANARAATLRPPASQCEGGIPQRAICCRTRCGNTQAKLLLQFCRCVTRAAN